MGWPRLWAIFSKTNQVTLLTDFSQFKTKIVAGLLGARTRKDFPL
jgi:hypothetical protein